MLDTGRAPMPAHLYSNSELFELRRSTLRFARAFPPGPERNQHRQIALSLRALFKNEKWLRIHSSPETTAARS